jgi:hypothetical protein
MAVKRKPKPISDELWNSFETMRQRRLPTALLMASFVAVPLAAAWINSTGLVRPNLEVAAQWEVTDERIETAPVTWTVVNNGRFPVTVTAIELLHLRPLDDVRATIGGGESATFVIEYESNSEPCGPQGSTITNPVIHYSNWRGSHTVVERGIGIPGCDQLARSNEES